MSGDPRTDVTRLLDDLEAGWERWEVYDRRKVATWADPAGDCQNGLFSAPRWMDDDEVQRLVDQHNAIPKLLAAVRDGLALADELDDDMRALGYEDGHTTAAAFRAALTAPLAGQATTDEEGR